MNIEVESRALPTPNQRKAILEHMHTLGKVREVTRIMVDFSGSDREHTVTLRINDGAPELVVKSGGLSDNARQEAILQLTPGTPLATCLDYFALMGYTEGMVSLRKMYVVQTDVFEYSLRDVLDQDTFEIISTLFDLEAHHTAFSNEESAATATHNAMQKLGLKPLEPNEWEQWVEETYENVDKPFHHTSENVRKLGDLLKSLNL